MPLPLNFIDREFAQETRKPSAAFMRALSNLYEAFALIEDLKLDTAQLRLQSVVENLESAITGLANLSAVTDRWVHQDQDSRVFNIALSDLTSKLGFVPFGDRVVIDALLAELEQLRALVARHATEDHHKAPLLPIPENDEAQFFLTSQILRLTFRMQEIAMAATRLSIVTRGQH